MFRIVIGIVLMLWGGLGLLGNIILVIYAGATGLTLILNSVVCIVFIYAGRRLYESGSRSRSSRPGSPRSSSGYKGIYG